MTFKDANHMSLGVKIKCCYQCETTLDFQIGDETTTIELAPFESFELVHENKTGEAHWYIPETDFFIPNNMLQYVEIIGWRAKIKIGGDQ